MVIVTCAMHISRKPLTDLTDVLLYYLNLVLFADVLSSYLQIFCPPTCKDSLRVHCGEPSKSNRSRTTLSKDESTGSRIVALAYAAPLGKGKMS